MGSVLGAWERFLREAERGLFLLGFRDWDGRERENSLGRAVMALLIVQKIGVKIAELIGYQKLSCLMIKGMSFFDDDFVPFFFKER
jgi:hypothetical protein